jgi:hypothetical protein
MKKKDNIMKLILTDGERSRTARDTDHTYGLLLLTTGETWHRFQRIGEAFD